MRILGWIFTALLVIGIGTLTFMSLRQIQQTQLTPWQIVDDSADVVIAIHDPIDLWSKIDANSVIWQAFTDHDFFVELDAILDSVYQGILSHQGLDWEQAQQEPLLLALRPAKDGWKKLIICATGEQPIANLHDRVLQHFGFKPDALGEYSHAKHPWKWTYERGLLIGSDDAQWLSSTKVYATNLSEPEIPKKYQYALKTASKNAAMNVLFSPWAMEQILNGQLGLPKEWVRSIRTEGQIAELDVHIKPNSLTLNGYSWNQSDSLNQAYLSLFQHQTGGQWRATEYLPEDIAGFVSYKYSNFQAFRDEELKREQTDLNQIIQRWSEKLQLDVKTSWLSWFGQEMVVGQWVRNPKTPPTFIAFLSTDNPASSKDLISAFNAERSSEDYRDYSIARIDHPALLKELFGLPIDDSTELHYAVVDEMVVFTESIPDLKSYLNKYLGDKSLSKNFHFDRFSDHMSTHGNILVYSNPSISWPIYEKNLTEAGRNQLQNKQEFLSLFDGLSWQISHEGDGLFYNNIFFKYNPVTRSDNYTLWETPVDALVRSKPWIVKNHYTRSNEILVQDINGRIYLMDGKGSILWRRDLPEAIRGEVQQIDVFKNNKLQMLFSTDNHIYLIDRLGRNVEGFPIKLPAKATNSVALMDYDKNKNYRLLIACEDLQIHNYGADGKAVRGWKRKLKNAVTQPIKLAQIRGKDYLMTVDEKGTILAMNRKGDERLKLKSKALLAQNTSFRLGRGNSKSATLIEYCDTAGTVCRINLSDEQTTKSGPVFSKDVWFNAHDIDGNQIADYVFIDSLKLSVFDHGFDPIYSLKMDSSMVQKAEFYQFSAQGNVKLGLTDPKNASIYLYDAHGLLVDGFPLAGASPFTIADINRDGQLELVVAGEDALLYAYALED